MNEQSSQHRHLSRSALWCIALMALGAVMACDRKNDPSPTVEALGEAKTAPKGANSANPASVMPVSGTDRVFVVAASANGVAEVEAARLVLEKSRNAAVKSYAQQLVKEHAAANDELKLIASTKGITVLNALDDAGAFQIDKLRNASEDGFDAMFVQTFGVDAHSKTIRLFTVHAKEGQDVELRTFAERMLPKLREHLALAQQLQSKVTSK